MKKDCCETEASLQKSQWQEKVVMLIKEKAVNKGNQPESYEHKRVSKENLCVQASQIGAMLLENFRKAAVDSIKAKPMQRYRAG